LVLFNVLVRSDNPDLHQAIQDRENEMAAAMSAGNASLYASYYDPRAHLMLPGDDDYVGRDAIESAVQGLIDGGVKTATFQSIEVNFIHKFPHGWAYERGNYTLLNSAGQIFDAGNYVVVWSRTRDQHHWYPYYDINVSILPVSSVSRRSVPARQAVSYPRVPAPRTPEEDKLYDAITGANLEWMAAYDSADYDGVAALYTSNATLLPNHSPAVMGTTDIAQFFQNAMTSGIAQIDLSIIEVNVAYADNVAYEKSTYVFKDEDGNIIDEGKYIVIWSHEDGATYKLYIDCFNSDKSQ